MTRTRTIPARDVRIGDELYSHGRVVSVYTNNGTVYAVAGALYVPVHFPVSQLVKVRPSA